jgi:hypothetical protein
MILTSLFLKCMMINSMVFCVHVQALKYLTLYFLCGEYRINYASTLIVTESPWGPKSCENLTSSQYDQAFAVVQTNQQWISVYHTFDSLGEYIPRYVRLLPLTASSASVVRQPRLKSPTRIVMCLPSAFPKICSLKMHVLRFFRPFKTSRTHMTSASNLPSLKPVSPWSQFKPSRKATVCCPKIRESIENGHRCHTCHHHKAMLDPKSSNRKPTLVLYRCDQIRVERRDGHVVISIRINRSLSITIFFLAHRSGIPDVEITMAANSKIVVGPWI